MSIPVNYGPMVEIQMQDPSGNWRTYSSSQNIPLMYRDNMRQLQWQFPDARIRAVASDPRSVRAPGTGRRSRRRARTRTRIQIGRAHV